jgi:hypothetical protein
MNNLEKKEILSDQLLSMIDHIISKAPDVVFGGSIALNAVGLLNRPIGDIDLFISNKSSFKKQNTLDLFDGAGFSINDGFSETEMDINGNLIERMGYKCNDVKLCVFKVSDEELQHSKVTFLGRTINIQNVNYAIMAKQVFAEKAQNNPYANKTLKHIDDIFDINTTLNDLFLPVNFLEKPERKTNNFFDDLL